MKSRILLLDDDRDITEVVTLILLNKDYEVITYHDCNNIIDRVKQHAPCLVLMDLWIPEMGGEQATRIIKENSETCSTPVILFSANNDIENAAKRAGADASVKKPFDITHFEQIIARFIKQPPHC